MDDSRDPNVIKIALPIRLAANQTFSIANALTGASQITYAGAIDLSGRTLTFAAKAGDRGTQRVTGALSGTGAIVVAGGDPLYCSVVLAGTNTSTGTTTVNQGCKVFVNGDYSARTFTVGANGILAGRGTLGTTTALTGFSAVQVESDSSPTSILTVNGPLSLRSGSGLYMTINGPTPGTSYSQLVTKDKVTLGAYLVVDGNYHPYLGQQFTIVSNFGAAPITGTFQNLPEGGIVTSNSGVTYRITYKGNDAGHDIVLTAMSTNNVRVWTGGGINNLWTTAANWSGGAPKAGDDLYFPAGSAQTTNVDNFPAGTAFHSMYFQGDNGIYNISGNRIVLNGGVVSVGYNGNNTAITLSMPMTLGANSGFNVDNVNLLTLSGPLDLAGHDFYFYGTGHMVLSGVLTGKGTITDNAAGIVELMGSSPDAGAIVESDGFLSVTGDYHLRSVTVASGLLAGTGTVGALTATGGGITLQQTLTVAAKLNLGPGTTFEPELLGAGPGTVGQLAVKGPVVLGGTLRPTAGSFVDVGSVFTIVSTLGAAAPTGTFAGLPEGAVVPDSLNSSINYRISYKGGASGRDVTLTVLNPTLLPETDLAVTQTASPDPVAKGDRVAFNVTVTNNGPESTKVTVRDKVPAGTTLVALRQLAGWSCRTGTGAAGQGLRCTSNDELAAGSSQTFTLVLRVGADAGPTVTSKATASGGLSDLDTTNNTSVATVAVA